MSKWWLKAPILLFCILMIATVVVFGRVAYAATDSQLGQGIAGLLEALEIVVRAIIDLVLSM